MKIVLGSSSPRRREILGRIVDSFDTAVPEADESVLPGEEPLPYALRVAWDKARSIVPPEASARVPRLLISCDTIVSIEGEIIGKPADESGARGILRRLAGRTHLVISALCLKYSEGESECAALRAETTGVTFKKLGDEQIGDYLGRIHFLDKAGSYALQESGEMIIEHIEGSISNVIGFPLRLFFQMLSEMGLAEEALLRGGTAPSCVGSSICGEKD